MTKGYTVQKTISFTTDTITKLEEGKKKFEEKEKVNLTFSAYTEKMVKEGLDSQA